MRTHRTATGDRLAAKRRTLRARLTTNQKPSMRAAARSSQAKADRAKRQRWQREYHQDMDAARDAAGGGTLG